MKDFKAYLQAKDLSVMTQNAYIYNVQRFFNWYKQDPLNAQTKDILKYLEHLQETLKIQNATRQNHLIALQQYFDFLERPTVTAFIKLQATKKHRLSYVFTPQELSQLYDDYYNVFIQNAKPESIPLTQWRNYTMLGFLVYQGLSTLEPDTLKVSSIDFQKATLRVEPQGKRRANRTLPLQACQMGGLMHYLQIIRPKFTDDTDCQKLFLPLPKAQTTNTQNTSISSVLRHLHKHLKTLHKDYSKMAQLRTSVITHWIKNKGLRKAQYLAGHKSIVSTEEYVHNDLEALTEDLTKYHPF